jgi:hypothetical protein
MKSKDIWENIHFSEKKEESAYDLLNTQSDNLVKATKGELIMQVEAVDAFDEKNGRPAALYMLYVVAPNIGNFRRKILTVVENSESGRFPVDIICHLDNSPLQKGITKEQFIETIEEILSRPIVKNSIENLYKMSIEERQKLVELVERYKTPIPPVPNQNSRRNRTIK